MYFSERTNYMDKKVPEIFGEMVFNEDVMREKLPKDVYKSLTGNGPEDALEALDMLSDYSGVEIPHPLRNIGERKVIFDETVEASQMLDAVYKYISK